MARVVVVGAGLAGLACALEATTAGHHVVIMERSERIGGRGTTQNFDGFPFGFGPHLFLKKGPFHDLVRKLSRVRLTSSPIQLHRVEVLGHGVVRPVDDVKASILAKKILREASSNERIVRGCRFLASWNTSEISERYAGLQKNKLLVSNEGWSGMVGRMAAALDEVGVFIECGLHVNKIETGKVHLADGREIETDVIVLACGPAAARKLIRSVDEEKAKEIFSPLQRTTASFIEVGLDSKSLSGRQAIVDVDNQFAILDYRAIQPRLGLEGCHLSAVAVGGLETDPGETRFSSEGERLAALTNFMNQRASGWKEHIVQHSEQAKITILDSNEYRIPQREFANVGILLAGSWIESEHLLADASVDTGRNAGRSISSAMR